MFAALSIYNNKAITTFPVKWVRQLATKITSLPAFSSSRFFFFFFFFLLCTKGFAETSTKNAKKLHQPLDRCRTLRPCSPLSQKPSRRNPNPNHSIFFFCFFLWFFFLLRQACQHIPIQPKDPRRLQSWIWLLQGHLSPSGGHCPFSAHAHLLRPQGRCSCPASSLLPRLLHPGPSFLYGVSCFFIKFCTFYMGCYIFFFWFLLPRLWIWSLCDADSNGSFLIA